VCKSECVCKCVRMREREHVSVCGRENENEFIKIERDVGGVNHMRIEEKN